MEYVDSLIWIGIGLCVLQSGIFSGLNLAVFGASVLDLESQAAAGNKAASLLRELRRDSNFLLTTILWGNVGTNVLLTLLSDSVMAGALGFAFSTFVITFGGEIIPQAYFSRNALRMVTLLRPVLLPQFMVDREGPQDDVIDDDLVLVWGDPPRIITGADLLGRLLRGVARPAPTPRPGSRF